MKREGLIYILVGMVVSALMFLQDNPFSAPDKNFVTEVKQFPGFNRIQLDIRCNIFLLEGEKHGIVYE